VFAIGVVHRPYTLDQFRVGCAYDLAQLAGLHPERPAVGTLAIRSVDIAGIVLVHNAARSPLRSGKGERGQRVPT